MQQDINLDELGARARTAIGWKLAAQGSATVVQMVTGIILARLLLPSDFGILTAAMIVVGLGRIFQDLGLGQALVQRKEIKRPHLVSAFWGTLVLGMLICGLVVVGAPLAGAFFNDPRTTPALQAISVSFLITPFAVIPNALLQRQLDFKAPFKAGMAGTGMYAGVGLAMALVGYGYWSLVGAQLASVVAETAAICLLTRYSPPLIPSLRGVGDLYAFGVGVTGAVILNYVAQQADYVVVGRCLNSSALGLYRRSFSLVHTPTNAVGKVLFPVLFPAFGHLQDDPDRARSVFARVVRGVSFFTFPALALLAISAPELIPLVLGDQWRGAVVPTQIMAVAGMLRTVINPGAALARGFGKVYDQVWRNGVYAVVLTVAAVIGTRWGIVGVAWGAVVATVVVFFLNAHLVHACSGFGAGDYARALGGPLATSAAVVLGGGVVRGIALATDQSMPAVLALTLLAGLLAGIVTAIFNPFLQWRAFWTSLFPLGIRRLGRESPADQSCDQ